jgi:hypothetical protein
MGLTTMVSIETAAEETHSKPSQIRSLVALGATETAQTLDGSIIISLDQIKRLETILVEASNLNGNPIHVSEASRKYDIPIGSLSRWAEEGYIETLGSEKNRRLLNEGDVALISRIRDAAGMKPGQSLSSVVRRLTS